MRMTETIAGVWQLWGKAVALLRYLFLDTTLSFGTAGLTLAHPLVGQEGENGGSGRYFFGRAQRLNPPG